MWPVLCVDCQRDAGGRTVAQLRVRRAQQEDFHVYTLVAENGVSVAAKDIPLVHSQSVDKSVYLWRPCAADEGRLSK